MPILKTPDSHLDDELAPLLPKLDKLMEHIRSLGPVGLGFSGGVDSTFLAAVCARCASDRVVLFHLDTPFIGTPEQRAFEHSLDMLGLPVARVALDPLLDERIVRNDGNRCYHCKLLGFRAIEQAARERGIETLLEGSNADDDETLRPGSRATRELGVRSPLRDLGWHKDEERAVLRAWGFAVWNLPAGACLATRVATGERLTPAALDIIRRCEDELGARGYRQAGRTSSGCARRAARIPPTASSWSPSSSSGSARSGRRISSARCVRIDTAPSSSATNRVARRSARSPQGPCTAARPQRPAYRRPDRASRPAGDRALDLLLAHTFLKQLERLVGGT